MKMLLIMLAVSLVFIGCSDSIEPIALDQGQEAISDVVEEVDEDVVSNIDSADDVLMLDVEEEAGVSVEEAPDVSGEEELGQLDEDPTSFRSNPDPSSPFFDPEIP